MVLSRTERSGQVIKLLEYAINQNQQSLPEQNSTAKDSGEDGESAEVPLSTGPQKTHALPDGQERDPAPHEPN
jgi:D-alanyl-D-alanine carboxypeptidase